MMQEKIKSVVKGSFGAIGIAILVVAVICIVPFITLWTINTMAELGGADFYIAHDLFSYFVAFVFVAIVRG